MLPFFKGCTVEPLYDGHPRVTDIFLGSEDFRNREILLYHGLEVYFQPMLMTLDEYFAQTLNCYYLLVRDWFSINKWLYKQTFKDVPMGPT